MRWRESVKSRGGRDCRAGFRRRGTRLWLALAAIVAVGAPAAGHDPARPDAQPAQPRNSPRVFAQGLLQYNDSDDLWSVNLRFGWLQDANTGLFLVCNETEGLGDFIPGGAGRSVILKYSHLVDVLD